MIVSGTRPLKPVGLRAIRGTAAFAIAGSAVLVLIPLLDGPSSEGPADANLYALVSLLVLLPMWILPMVIFGCRTISQESNLLSGETLRRRVDVDLSKATRVWVRCVQAGLDEVVYLGIHDSAGGRVWISWFDSRERVFGQSMLKLAAELARDPSVKVSARARALLELPGAPGRLGRCILALRTCGLFVLLGAVLAFACAAYFELA